MPKKQYDIDFKNYLRSLNIQTFTVTDITENLLVDHSHHFEKTKNATQFVYRRLKALTKSGILEEKLGEKGKANRFRWTESKEKIMCSLKGDYSSTNNDDALQRIQKLKDKIKLYEAEMLANLGETEAYNEWAQDSPESAEEIKHFHQQTREQAKLMLGKVKGFERLLSFYKEKCQ